MKRLAADVLADYWAVRCIMWNIPSVVDGQGRALGSGSILDIPLATKANHMNIFRKELCSDAGFLLYVPLVQR